MLSEKKDLSAESEKCKKNCCWVLRCFIHNGKARVSRSQKLSCRNRKKSNVLNNTHTNTFKGLKFLSPSPPLLIRACLALILMNIEQTPTRYGDTWRFGDVRWMKDCHHGNYSGAKKKKKMRGTGRLWCWYCSTENICVLRQR